MNPHAIMRSKITDITAKKDQNVFVISFTKHCNYDKINGVPPHLNNVFLTLPY